MEKEQLTKLIDHALSNGWSEYEFRYARGANSIATWVMEGEHSLNDILFGDDLSFLKALVGDAPMSWQIEKQIEPGNPQIQYVQTTIEAFRLVVVQLALLPDDQRIPWLYTQVFEGEQS